MGEQLPPDWAIERVQEITGYYWPTSTVAGHAISTAFARYIAKHEEPPVDPLLIEAREVWAREREESGNSRVAALYRAGRYDSDPAIKTALAALKRGIEIGKGQS